MKHLIFIIITLSMVACAKDPGAPTGTATAAYDATSFGPGTITEQYTRLVNTCVQQSYAQQLQPFGVNVMTNTFTCFTFIPSCTVYVAHDMQLAQPLQIRNFCK